MSKFIWLLHVLMLMLIYLLDGVAFVSITTHCRHLLKCMDFVQCSAQFTSIKRRRSTILCVTVYTWEFITLYIHCIAGVTSTPFLFFIFWLLRVKKTTQFHFMWTIHIHGNREMRIEKQKKSNFIGEFVESFSPACMHGHFLCLWMLSIRRSLTKERGRKKRRRSRIVNEPMI